MLFHLVLLLLGIMWVVLASAFKAMLIIPLMHGYMSAAAPVATPLVFYRKIFHTPVLQIDFIVYKLYNSRNSSMPIAKL